MSTRYKHAAALSIGAVMLVGALAFGNRHHLISAVIVLPAESARMYLAPAAVAQGKTACCTNGVRP